jgi:SSS family solute:Na+ symporter
MSSVWVVLAMVAGYMALLAGISYVVRRSSKTSEGFTNGGKSFPAFLIGFLLMSEFIGTSATIGTAQSAYEVGISAAWNVMALAIGFVLFGLFIAKRFRKLGHNTISGALAHNYGNGTRLATSVLMTAALLIVAVAIYAAGGAILHELLDISQSWATVIIGVLATLYVVVGGMRSVIYTNVLHALLKLGTVALLVFVGLHRVGGLGQLSSKLPADSFSLDGVGWAQIFAWLIAGIGAIFATQYVVQAVITVDSPRRAQQASFYSALLLIPFGILAALVGMCSTILYPKIESIDALPVLAVDLNSVATGFVMCGLTGAILGSIAALILGASTLMMRDFYRPYFNRSGDDRKDLAFLRIATFVAGVLPILLALYASNVLAVTFLAKSLRASLAVLVVMMFFKPGYGSRKAAMWSIILAVPATIGWFLAGDPFGVDNAYIAVATPLVVMTIGHLLRSGQSDTAPALAAEAPARARDGQLIRE